MHKKYIFRWKKHTSIEDSTKDEWIGIFGGCVWWLIQESDHILYKVIDSFNREGTHLFVFHIYFFKHVNILRK